MSPSRGSQQPSSFTSKKTISINFSFSSSSSSSSNSLHSNIKTEEKAPPSSSAIAIFTAEAALVAAKASLEMAKGAKAAAEASLKFFTNTNQAEHTAAKSLDTSKVDNNTAKVTQPANSPSPIPERRSPDFSNEDREHLDNLLKSPIKFDEDGSEIEYIPPFSGLKFS